MTTTSGSDLGPLPDRLLAALIGSYEVAAVALGDRLGWYRCLASSGPATATELAGRTDTDARYAREWLEHQAVSGYLVVDDASAGPEDRRYSLPEEHRAVLAEPLHPDHMAPLTRLTTALVRWLPELTDVYRGRRTLSWADLGDDAREAQAAANRPFFAGPLVRDVLPAVPGVDAALTAGGRVADIGCGYGWSSIAIAARWPAARVDGFDVDVPSVQRARRNAEEAGVAERCTVRSDDVLRLMYGYSLLCCLPDGRSHQPSVGTGTVMRPAVLRDHARRAGFTDVEVLPVDAGFFRVYRLAP